MAARASFSSSDKAIAVIYPLKSSIWLSKKRASYICYATSVILFVANLPFIYFATQKVTGEMKFCGLDDNRDPLVLDIITASILPIGRYSRMRRISAAQR